MGTRLEALIGERWGKKLQQEDKGWILLDVNPTYFCAIVDYLNEMMILSEENPPGPPSVDDEWEHILWHQI